MDLLDYELKYKDNQEVMELVDKLKSVESIIEDTGVNYDSAFTGYRYDMEEGMYAIMNAFGESR
jgi:hypothetical protein